MSADQQMNNMDPVTPAGTKPAPAFVSAPARQGFTFTMSHALMAVAAAVVLVAILGVVAYVVLGAGTFAPVAATPTGPVVAGQPVTPGTPSAPGSTAASAVLPPVASTDNRDVFTPRNPFQPLDAPTVQAAAVADTSAGSSDSKANANTLVLKDIVTVDGKRKAVVTLGGKEYTVGVGDTIDSSNYKVVEVNSSTIVVLYGDQRVTLSVGTGVSK